MTRWCRLIPILITFLFSKNLMIRISLSILLMSCWKINTLTTKRQKEIVILIWKSKRRSKSLMSSHWLLINNMDGDNQLILSQLVMEWSILSIKNCQLLFKAWIELRKLLHNDFFSFIFYWSNIPIKIAKNSLI